jgi:hypothetical protein
VFVLVVVLSSNQGRFLSILQGPTTRCEVDHQMASKINEDDTSDPWTCLVGISFDNNDDDNDDAVNLS